MAILSIAGTLTTGNNLTVNGDLYLKYGTCHKSIDIVNRLFYGANEISYYCCGATGTDVFMNGGYSHVLKIKNNGDLLCNYYVGIQNTTPLSMLHIYI